MTETLVDAGFNTNFGPVADLFRPKTFIANAERSFSDSPEEVTANAQLFSQSYKNASIACAYKHFPGHGSAAGDSHKGFVDVTKTWQPEELEPYKFLLAQEEACPIVMIAHVINHNLNPSGKPATLSQATIEGKLRKEMRFQGVVISDCMQMKAIKDNYTRRVTHSNLLSMPASICWFLAIRQFRINPLRFGKTLKPSLILFTILYNQMK